MSRVVRGLVSFVAACGTVIGLGVGSASAAVDVTVPVGGDIQLALAQVAQAGGGTVTLEAGTYYLTGPLTVWSNTTVVGQGPSTLLQDTPAAHGQGFQPASDGESNIIFEDFTIDGATDKNAFLSSGGQDNPYGGVGFYFWTEGNAFSNLTFDNITSRHFGLGLFLGTVAGVTLDGDNFVDNNQVGNFAHDVYLVNCWSVSIDNSRFDYSDGDGLHMDLTALGFDSINNSEFSHDSGEGVLWQGNMNYNSISHTATDYDGNDGINADSVYSNFDFDRGNYNRGYQLNLSEGDSLNGQYGYGNGGGFPAIFWVGGPFTNVAFSSPPPNTYWAAMADDVVGPYPTADWTTAYGGGSSGIGEVDFAGFPSGKLAFDNVGATVTATTGATISYQNPSGSTVTMGVSVNGQSAGTVTFAPTSGSWSTVNLNLPLQSGNNVIVLSAEPGGTPVIDDLQVNTPVPAAPTEPTNVTATATGPYQIDLTWSPVPGAQTYTITRGGDTLATNITSTHYSDQDIPVSGSTESYTVTAVNQGGGSPASPPVTATTPPDFPAGVSLSGHTVSWMTINGAVSYNIGRSTVEGGPYTVIANVPNTTSIYSNFMQYYTDASAATGTTYYYAVASVSGSGKASVWSAEVGASLAPVAVTPGDGQVTLSWAGGQTNYQVTASPGGETCSSTGPTSCTVTGLTNGQSYRFTISGGGETAEASGTPYPAALMSQAGGLSLWLDGANATTAYTSPSCQGQTAQAGQAVGCWDDQSGGSGAGDGAVDWTASTQPTLGSLSGHAAVSFASGTAALSALNGTYQTVCLAAAQAATESSQAGQHVICAESATPETVAAAVSSSGFAGGLTGAIGEVVGFGNMLTAGQLTTIEDYLELKWDATLDVASQPVTSTPSSGGTTSPVTSSTTAPATSAAAKVVASSPSTQATATTAKPKHKKAKPKHKKAKPKHKHKKAKRKHRKAKHKKVRRPKHHAPKRPNRA